ncbi:MAG: CinA family nicotinamide mononucleotide deamidase-related protein [Myxococcales bacterium]|nr:CinA family nicotinamide mononucleotide deamidase-related protein [Myxococcales bacterium]
MQPSAEIICVGDELLAGDTLDTNSADIARFLRLWGVTVRRAVSVADGEAAIVGALEDALGADLCVVTGGLGPTGDDLTAAAVASAAGVDRVRSPAAIEAITARLAARGHACDEVQLRQAEVPAGATIVDNPIGIAPGFALDLRGTLVVCLPGVPTEVRAMLEGLASLLRARLGDALGPRPRRILRVFGLREGDLAGRLEPIFAALGLEAAGAVVHYRARGPEIEVTIDVGGAPSALVDAAISRAREALGDAVYGLGEADLAARVVAALIAAELRVASAESCTGGRVAAAITGIAGSSACFHGAIVAYDNGVKSGVLGVDEAILAEHGAVSEPVARAMAEGVRVALAGHADIGVGITGIAGPGGGSPAKPVGTVDFAVSDGERTTHRRLHLRGDRSTIQAHATAWALWLVWERLRERGLAEVTELAELA